MLQPRVSRVSRRNSTKLRARTTHLWISSSASSKIFFSLLVILLVLPHGFTQYTDKPFIVEPTPALRLNEEDLTTVLLVNNDNTRGDHVHGRYVNVRPDVGLLKTTARTFIQEGVTTEYATQVLGTTLENGRLYAQLLKKSSRVLYEPSVVTSWVGEGLQTKSLLQSHNDLFNADQPDWQDIDDRLLLEKNAFVGNADNIGFHELRFQKLSNRNRSEVDSSNSTSSTVSTSRSESSSASSEHGTPKFSGRKEEIEKEVGKISANKVLPFGDLPTYTVKNHFAPSGFSWDSGSVVSDATLQQSQEGVEENVEDPKRSPKVYYNQIMGSEAHFTAVDAVKAVRPAVKSFLPSRVLSTITYYGFADFTTLVGDSVIVFSPSSVMPSVNFGHVTSIKGEATLGGNYERVSDVMTTVMPELIVPTYVDQSTIVAPTTTHVASGIDEGVLEMHNSQEQHSTVANENEQQTIMTTSSPTTTTTAVEETTSEATDDSQREDTTTTTLVSGDDAVRQDVIKLESSEVKAINESIAVTASKTITQELQVASSSQPVLLSRPSNEEILRIYASLASAEAARQAVTTLTSVETTRETTTMEPIPQKPITEEVKVEKEEPIQKSDVKVLGGATTIFFEDDPFANFIEPTTTVATAIEPTATITQLVKSEESNVIYSTAVALSTESNIIATTPTTPASDVVNAEEHVTSASAVKSKEHLDEETTTNIPIEVNETTEAIAEEQLTTTPTVDSTTPKLVAAVIVKEISENEAIDATNCKRTSQVFLTQLPKTLTYYTTYLIPDEQTAEQTITSIETNIVPTFDIGQATKHYCIQSTNVLDLAQETAIVQLEKPLTAEVNQVTRDQNAKSTTENSPTTQPQQLPSTTPMIIVRQNQIVTEHSTDAAQSSDEPKYATTEDAMVAEDEYEETGYEEDEETGDEAEGDQEDDSEEEVDLIYKTLYTTYTYLTTFFHDDTTSISSHKEVITNVITSTNKPESGIEATKMTDLYSDNEISPTSKFVVPTELASVLHLEEDDYIEEQLSTTDKGAFGVEATTFLDDSKLTKTYFTTYTYYTTIYAAGETEVMSRTEVFTNHVTDTIAPTSTAVANENHTTSIQEIVVDKNSNDKNTKENNVQPTASLSTKQDAYSTLQRNRDESMHVPDLTNYSSVTLVTDVRSSSSNGDHQIINDGLEDQISSESNTDEIIPSATLLLQTSFTTFTYYTTMYSGDNTNVISRLETITNVATETLQPSKTVNIEEATLPITYFTTFTYWTKLSKDGEITTLSREETVSNVVTPTNVQQGIEATATDNVITELSASLENDVLAQPNISSQANLDTENAQTSSAIVTTNMENGLSSAVEPTTFYTTYTYYTTSYVNDQTFTDSRFETVTNVVTPTLTPVVESEAKTLLSTVADVQSIEETLSTTSIPPKSSAPEIIESVISYDNKKIIDADGVSTLYFTTKIVATTADGGNPIEITSSGSSLQVDEIKRALLPTSSAPEVNSDGSTVRQYKTGLVRLIEGTRIANATTTLYQSRVIGTVIDKRYAQIIESTSSFLIEKTKSPQLDTQLDISASATVVQPLQSTQQPSLDSITASPDSLEGSITESIEKHTEENLEHADENAEEEEGDGNKSPFRFAIQSKKRTFTPVIRPFVSRNRPQFAPKKKNVSASSATIITRTDFTPTITATPALKSAGRFSSSRRSGFSNGAAQLTENVSSGASSSKRFSRPNKPSAGPNQPFAGSVVPYASASGNFGGQRNRLTSSRISPSSSLRRSSSSSRSSSFGGFRTGLSSAYAGNSRLRIKPTSTLSIGQKTTSVDSYTADVSDEEESSTQESVSEDEEEESTTENSRRNQNPLLRFRRPLVSRPNGFTPATPQRQNTSGNSPVSQRRNPLSSRAKATTSTTTTTTTSRPRPRSFQRPAVTTLQGRTRPQSNLFPPRGLFQQQQQVSQDIDQNTEDKSKNDEDFNDGGDADDDSEYEDEEDEEGEDEIEDDSNRRRRSNKTGNSRSINPLKSPIKVTEAQSKQSVTVKRRSKREADTSQQTRSNFRNRYRRPSKPAAGNDEKNSEEEPEIEAPSTTSASRPRVGVGSRFNSRSNLYHSTSTTTAAAATTNNHRAIRPTRPASGRAQFTLRERDTTPAIKKGLTRPSSNNFRRPKITSSSRRTPTPSANNRRLKSYTSNNAATENTSRSSPARPRHGTLSTTSRTRGSTIRGRGRNDIDPALPLFDGTITVTHVIPAEVTIPVINGKITEYKNVVTAKTSTEVLGPHQYTAHNGANRQPTTTLIREDTSVNFAGATEITQFILHETPTTTVTFTPTTIRGRKTSFSHVIPSTAYSVENVISTTQPEIAANAPLANILLSQLLLGNIGNIGLPQNPLLGALGGVVTQPAQLGAPPTPVTEFRTHTSTYVTTLFEGMSTVIPVTFQGKKILTTIFDTTAETITATEFITDTIVTTPTQQPAQAAQVNSLLLQQLLLQQQQQQQFQQQQQPLPILNPETPSPLLLADNLQELDTNNIRVSNEAEGLHDLPMVDETQAHKSVRKKNRKPGKSAKRHKQPAEHKSSVITLYVSGRRPGEFSTILSTVPIDFDSTQHKRHVAVQRTTSIDSPEDFYAFDGSEIFSEYALPEVPQVPMDNLMQHSIQLNEKNIVTQLDRNILDLSSESSESTEQTQSLESIVGDVSLWYAKSTAQYERQLAIKTTSKATSTAPGADTNAEPTKAISITLNNSIISTEDTHEHMFVAPLSSSSPLSSSVAATSALNANAKKRKYRSIAMTATAAELSTSNTNTMNVFYHGTHDIKPSQVLPQLEEAASALITTHILDYSVPLSNKPVGDFDDFEMEYFSGQAGVLEPHLGSADEARYNLATRIMSNGVEVIIAGDKSKTIEPNGNNNNSNNPNIVEQKSQILRILQTPINKPVTLAPSTLQDQMILVKPSNVQENYTIPIDGNNFITKTCLTTYTYRTTYLQDGHTTVESREKVISNIATEERNYLNLSPTTTSGIILSRTPEFAVGVFHTKYTYYNTILDGELPLVVSSEHTVINTITGPDVYISFLQPSEDATPVLETNTYYSKITLTKTLRGDATLQKVTSMSNILTQVIVTESLPSRSTSVMTSYYAFDESEYNETESILRVAANEHSLITAQPQKSTSYSPQPTTTPSETLGTTSVSENDLHIYATKTFLTTLTYLTTTLLNTAPLPMSSITPSIRQPTQVSSTIVNYHTRVIENVITETVPSSLLRSDLLKHFRSELKNTKNERKIIVTLATLSGGQTLEITAMNIIKTASAKQPETTEAIKSTVFSSSSTKIATSSHKVAKISKTRKSNSKTSQTINNLSSSRTAYIAPTRLKAASSLSQSQTKKATLHTKTHTLVQQEEDSAVASSEQDNVYIDNVLPNKNTKVNFAVAKPPASSSKLPGTVNQLIGSLNLNRLHALRPVFNAMAGLLQNNFGGGVGTAEQHKPSLAPAAPAQLLQIESKHALRNISSHVPNYELAASNSHIDRPIYIPVQNMVNDGEQQKNGLVTGTADTERNPAQLSPQSLHIQPPAADMAISDDNWLQEAATKLLQYEKKQQQHFDNNYNSDARPGDPISRHETPLINGGIPISPGEVITANSDVIIGKPNGIQHPRVPYGSETIQDNSAAANTQIGLQPPPEAEPATTFYQHFIQHPPYEKSALRQTNAIPFLRHNFKGPGYNEPPRQQHQQQYQQHQHKNSVFSSATNFDNILKPPALQPNVLPPSYIQPPPLPPPSSLSMHQHSKQQHEYTQQQVMGFSPPAYSEHKYYTIEPDQHQLDFNFNKELHHNEILEIKRIPEVYSTDIPPRPEFDATLQPAREAQYAAGMSQPALLVDVQPSRITNVLIPHDVSNASGLVLSSSSTSGPHKHGQYYNEPNPHFSIITNKQPTVTFTTPTTIKTTSPKQSITLQAVQAQGHKNNHYPVSNSNHQKINFDTHVLSHNVDINAPPLTFKKESEFPHSVPVRGHIPNDMVSQQQSSFYSIPLVKIPLNEENIQVELTPQNVIGSLAIPTIAQQVLTKQQQQHELDASTFGSFALPMPQNEKNFATAKQQVTSYGNFNKLSYNANNNLNSNYLKAPERHRVVSKNKTYTQSEHVSILENPFTNELHRIVPGAGGTNSYGQKLSPPFIPTKQNTKPALQQTSTAVTHPTTGPLRVQFNNKSNFNEPFYSSVKPYNNYGQRLTPASSATSTRPTQSLKNTRRPFLRPTKKHFPSASSSVHFANMEHGKNSHSQIADQQFKTSLTAKPTATTMTPGPPKPTKDYWNQNLVTYEDDLADDTTNTFNDDQNAAPSLNNIRLPAPSNGNFPATQHLNKNNWEQAHADIILQPFISEMSMHSLHEMNEQLRTTTTTPAPTTKDFSAVMPTKKHNQNPYKGLLPLQGRPFEVSNQTNKWSGSKSNERLKQHIFVATGEGFRKPQVTDTPIENTQTPIVQTSVNVSINRTQLRLTTPASFWVFDSSTTPASTTIPELSTIAVTNVPIEQQEMQTKLKTKDNDDEIFDFHETSNPHNYGSVNTTKVTSVTHNLHQSSKPPDTTTSMPNNKRPNNVVDSRNATTTLHNNPNYKYRPVVDKIRTPLQTQTVAETEAVLGLIPPPPPAPTSASLPTPINTSPAKTSTPYKTINFTNKKRLPLMPLPQLNNDLKLKTTRQPTKEQVILKPPPLPSPTTPAYVERTLPSSLTPPPVASNTFKPTHYSDTSSTLTMAKSSAEVLVQTISKVVDRRKNATTSHPQRKQPTTPNNQKPHKISEHIPVISSEVASPSDIPLVTSIDLTMPNSFPESTQLEEKKITISPTKTKQSETPQTTERKPVQDWSRNSNAAKLPPNQHRANTQILRLSSKRIILPTKFITNTQILTVTTTETTVLTTAGKHSTKTLTLIKTQTATILDTVTEIHTLLQPTRVAETITASTLSTTPTQNIPLQPLHTQPVSYDENDQNLANHKPYRKLKNDAFEIAAAGHPSVEVVLEDAAVNQQQQSHKLAQKPIADTEVTSLHNDPSKNSIFIVMTDSNSKTGGIINVNPNMLETAHNINAIGVTASDNIDTTGGTDEEVLDYDDKVTFDLPSRDEETVPNVGKADHVLLGGVLIATPPKSSSSSATTLTKNSKETTPGSIATLMCRPACKASRNEVCMQVQTRVRCICRPGFARMFPDRPCKPTYTYAMRLHVHRLANDVLHFEHQLMNNESEDFRQLATITHDAVDRMVMQSDFRDVYHGVHLTSFESGEQPSSATSGEKSEDDIVANMLLQLSDKSDEERLGNVFKKYLRLSNYSIGGTELYTTKNGVENMAIVDFDECKHSKFHDCSAYARCFNLQGSYTCSCQEGYVDLSENPIFPGRICSAEIIGCEKCHYHGKCMTVTTAGSNKTPVCECFPWYTGATCQLNLKILLIALIAVGTLLFILLLFCVLVTCSKRNKHLNARSLMHASMHKIASKNSRLSVSTATTSRHKSQQLEKRAMIKDSSSETSLNSIPYVLKDVSSSIKQHKMHGSSSCFDGNNHHMHSHYSAETGSALITSLEQSINELHHHFPEQSDRSLTVMIPRAKYHPTVLPQAQFVKHHQLSMERTDRQLSKSSSGALSAVIVDDSKDAENMQVQTSCNTQVSKAIDTSKQTMKSKKMSTNSSKHNGGGGMLAHANVGSLVSAGFEVSATVSANLLNSSTRGAIHSSSTTSDGIADVSNGVGDNDMGKSYGDIATNSGCAIANEFHQQLLPSYMAEVRKAEQSESHESEYNTYKDGEELIESMDMWLDNIHQTELTAEARSFDETVVQAATKSKRSCFDSSTSQTNDEANTMTERDIGSTFLLPHTHLYKPDRQESETSGFDFI